MIESISFNKENEVFKGYSDDSGANEIKGLKRVNIFVGPNNSGKSRFLRELFISFLLKENSDDKKFNDINFPFIEHDKAERELDNLLNHFLEIHKSLKIHFQDGIDIQDKENKIKRFKTSFKSKIKDNWIYFNDYVDILNSFNFKAPENTSLVIEHKIEEYNNEIDNFFNTKYKSLETYSVYIPVLRGLKKVFRDEQKPENAAYFSRIRCDYFEKDCIEKKDGKEKKISIKKEKLAKQVFTGENLYEVINNVKDSAEVRPRKNLKNFVKFLGETFFNAEIELDAYKLMGKDEKGNNIENKFKDISIRLGKEKFFYIKDLGDGIQSIIILTYQLFLNKDKNLKLFIEEPELNLHPSLQRLFLETLLRDEFKNVQVFFSTHSNHFLDMAIEKTSDVAVFSFQKQQITNEVPSFNISNITERSSIALELLGVNTSSVFLSNCTIWVEGISDIIYFRKYLELYKEEHKDSRKYMEDIHYSFVEYGGNNITHWSFIDDKENDSEEKINFESLSRNIFLISDKDKNKEKRHRQLKKIFGDNFYPLKCREVENLLFPKVLKETIQLYLKKGKQDNLEDFSYAEYKDEPIGNFINGKITDKNYYKIVKMPPGGKTYKIIDKYKFSKRATSKIKTYDDLTEEAKKLTEKMYRFIERNNESVLNS